MLGREATHVDFVGNLTLTRYDDLGRRDRVDYYLPGLDPEIDSPTQSVDYGYDPLGRPISTVQSSAQVAAGLPPGPARAVSRAYDQAGRLVSVASPEGVVHYGYDPATGRQTRVWTTPDASPDSPLTSDVFYAYDPFGRLTTVTTARQRGFSLPTPEEGKKYYGGDPSRPTDIPNPEVTRYYYDAANQLVRTLLPTEIWTLYEYDPQGRVQKVIHVKDNGAAAPLPVADLDPLEIASDARFIYTRDAAGRITAVDEVLRRPGLNSAGWDASRVDYVYDALGRLTKETRVISNPFGALYSPDLDWLSQVNQASFRRNGYVVDYTLDLVGNRVGQVRKQSTYTAYRSTSETVSYERTTSQFDARDRLFAEVGETAPAATGPWTNAFQVSYAYDANGSLESKTRTGTAAETTTYEFDVRNRLAATERNRTVTVGTVTTTTQPEKLVGQYVYDDAGIRTRVRETTTTGSGASASVTTTITDYLLDHQNPTGYAQAIEERVTSGTGTVASPPVVNPPLATALPSVSYVFGHELITQARQGANATSQPRTAVYRHDAHSGVRQLAGGDTTYPTTTVVYDNYTYEAFGTLLSNPSQITNRGTANTHLYRGEVWDAGLGLTYLRARYVDHRTGRFVGMDPWEGSLENPLTFQDFVYAHVSPLALLDPSGFAATGHHWAPQSVLNELLQQGRITNAAYDFLLNEAATEPELFYHGADTWNDITHIAYRDAVSHYVGSNINSGVLNKDGAIDLLRDILGNASIEDANLKTIRSWRNGFFQSIVSAEQAQLLDPSLSRAELKRVARAFNGATLNLTSKEIMALNGVRSVGVSSLRLLASRAVTKILPAVTFALIINSALDGYANTGIVGALDAAAREAIPVDLVNSVFTGGADLTEAVLMPNGPNASLLFRRQQLRELYEAHGLLNIRVSGE